MCNGLSQLYGSTDQHTRACVQHNHMVHLYIHRIMQTQMYIHTQTHSHTCKCTHTCMHMQMHTHAHTHTHTHTRTPTLALPCVQWFPPSKDSQQCDVGGCSDSTHASTSSTSSRNNDGFDLMEVEPRAMATSVGRSAGDTTNTVKGTPYSMLY